MIGDKVNVNTIEGVVKIKITPGTQSGDIFKIKGKGIRTMDGRGFGDHLVEIQVITPQKLSREQKKAIEQLRDLGL